MDFYWIGQAFLNALTVGRYGSSNRGETRPREIIRKRAVADPVVATRARTNRHNL